MSEQRRDWDYVTFSDYQRDMDELGAQAAAVSERLIRKQKELEMMLWAAVEAAGGSVKISARAFHTGFDKDGGLTWVQSYDQANDMIELKCYRRKT